MRCAYSFVIFFICSKIKPNWIFLSWPIAQHKTTASASIPCDHLTISIMRLSFILFILWLDPFCKKHPPCQHLLICQDQIKVPRDDVKLWTRSTCFGFDSLTHSCCFAEHFYWSILRFDETQGGTRGGPAKTEPLCFQDNLQDSNILP